MKSSPATPPPTDPALPQLSMRELTTALIRYHGLHEGKYELLVEFGIGIGPVPSPNGDQLTPGAMVALSKIGLQRTAVDHPNAIDAAIANPPPKKARTKKP